MKQSYLIGVLFSTSGPYALLGRDALDGALMGLAEVNDDPAFGFTLAPLTGDPGGITDRYQVIADRLIADGARHIVGGITSWSRKEMIPVVERRNALLWYPCPYEGYESSDRVVYTGACPNQHIVPLFAHLVPRFGSRVFLVGSNYIWGWETNRIARKLIEDQGGAVLGERYLPLGQTDVERIVAEIEEARPDFVLNNLIGPSSYAFLKAMAALAAGDPDFAPDRRPVASCDLAECELGQIGEAGIGHYATAVYFDSLDTPENRRFLARVRRRFGHDRRVSAFFVCAYMSILMLAEAIRETGSDEPDAIVPVLLARAFASPMGPLRISARNRHTAFAPLLGRIAPGNVFRLVEPPGMAIEPDPYLSNYDGPVVAPANDAVKPALRVVGT
jgi:ABC-type branched-subunit amino acid transport system substrate-binding protein